MTKDEIIRMAREAGALIFQSNFCDSSFDFNSEQLERFYQLAFAAGAAHEREKFKKVADDVLGWVCAGDRQKAFTDADFVGECVRIRLTGLTMLAEIVEPGCRERAIRKFTDETAAAIRAGGEKDCGGAHHHRYAGSFGG